MKVKVSFKEYNAWRESLEAKKAEELGEGRKEPDVITLDASESSGAKDGGSGDAEEDDPWVIEDGRISPLFEGSLPGGSNPSIEELMESLGVGDEGMTTYQLLMGNSFDDTIFSDKHAPEKVPEMEENQVVSSSTSGARKDAKKKRRPKRPKKVDINSIYFLMRAAQQLNPNVMMPWLSNLLPQPPPGPVPPLAIAHSSSSRQPQGPSTSRGNPESTWTRSMVHSQHPIPEPTLNASDRGNASTNRSTWSSTQEDEIRLIEQYLMEEMSPGMMINPLELVKHSQSHYGPNKSAIAPNANLSESEGRVENLNDSLVTPAKFLIPSIEPLVKDFEEIKLKSLLQDRNKRLPDFRTLKKRRLPRSVFIEMDIGHGGGKRYHVEGDPPFIPASASHSAQSIIPHQKPPSPQGLNLPLQRQPAIAYRPQVAAVVPAVSMALQPRPLMPALVPVTTVSWVPTTVMLPVPVTTIVPVWPPVTFSMFAAQYSSAPITTSAGMNMPPVTVTAAGTVFKAPYPVSRLPLRRDPVNLPMVTSGPSVLQSAIPVNQPPQVFPKQSQYPSFGEPYQYPIIRSQQPVQHDQSVQNRYVSTASNPVMAPSAQYTHSNYQNYQGYPQGQMGSPYRYPLPQSYYPGLPPPYQSNTPNVNSGQGGYSQNQRQYQNPSHGASQNVVSRVSASYPVGQVYPQSRLSYPSMTYSQGGQSTQATTTTSQGYQQQRFGGQNSNRGGGWGYPISAGGYSQSGYYPDSRSGPAAASLGSEQHQGQFNGGFQQRPNFQQLLPYQQQKPGMGQMGRSNIPPPQQSLQQYNPARGGYPPYNYQSRNSQAQSSRFPGSGANSSTTHSFADGNSRASPGAGSREIASQPTGNIANATTNSSPRVVANVQDIYSIYNRERGLATNQPGLPSIISGGERVLFRGKKPGGPESYPPRSDPRGGGREEFEKSQGTGGGAGGVRQTLGNQQSREGGTQGGHSPLGHGSRKFQESEKTFGEQHAASQSASVQERARGDHDPGRGGGIKTESSKTESSPETIKKSPSSPANTTKEESHHKLPHHGGDMPFYSQLEIDEHHKRMSHHTETPKDSEFENDSAILSWYLQRARQKLRERQEAASHHRPGQETQTNHGSDGQRSGREREVHRTSVQQGHSSSQGLPVAHPYGAAVEESRRGKDEHRTEAAQEPPSKSNDRWISSVPDASKMVQTSSNSSPLVVSPAQSRLPVHAHQNGLSSVSQRPSSAPSSPSPIASPHSSRVQSFNPHARAAEPGASSSRTHPNADDTGQWHFQQ